MGKKDTSPPLRIAPTQDVTYSSSLFTDISSVTVLRNEKSSSRGRKRWKSANRTLTCQHQLRFVLSGGPVLSRLRSGRHVRRLTEQPLRFSKGLISWWGNGKCSECFPQKPHFPSPKCASMTFCDRAFIPFHHVGTPLNWDRFLDRFMQLDERILGLRCTCSVMLSSHLGLW